MLRDLAVTACETTRKVYTLDTSRKGVHPRFAHHLGSELASATGRRAPPCEQRDIRREPSGRETSTGEAISPSSRPASSASEFFVGLLFLKAWLFVFCICTYKDMHLRLG